MHQSKAWYGAGPEQAAFGGYTGYENKNRQKGGFLVKWSI